MSSDAMKDTIRKRFDQVLAGPEMKRRYEAWRDNPDTRLFTEIMREALYRPMLPSNVLTGENAIFALGFIEGAFAFFDAMKDLSATPPVLQIPDPDYGAGDEKKEETKQ